MNVNIPANAPQTSQSCAYGGARRVAIIPPTMALASKPKTHIAIVRPILPLY
jgi:hypothetical protein